MRTKKIMVLMLGLVLLLRKIRMMLHLYPAVRAVSVSTLSSHKNIQTYFYGLLVNDGLSKPNRE